jgi:hypothetical protein
MSRSDYSEHLKNSRTNIGLELASIADLNSQWDWLVEHFANLPFKDADGLRKI